MSQRQLAEHEKVINEIYETEKSFCDGLSHLVGSLNFLEQGTKNKKDKKLIQDIKEQVNKITTNPFIGKPDIANLLRQMDFTSDSNFMNHLNEIGNLITICLAACTFIKKLSQENPELKNAADQFLKQYNAHYADIESVLVTPVQRIPRYELLLKDLHKKIPDDYKEAVETKLNTIKTMLKKINENPQVTTPQALEKYFKDKVDPRDYPYLASVEQSSAHAKKIVESIGIVTNKPNQDGFIANSVASYQTRSDGIGKLANKWEEYRSAPNANKTILAAYIQTDAEFQKIMPKMDEALQELTQVKAQLERLQQLKNELVMHKTDSSQVILQMKAIQKDKTNPIAKTAKFKHDYTDFVKEINSNYKTSVAMIDKAKKNLETQLSEKIAKVNNIDDKLINARRQTAKTFVNQDPVAGVYVFLANLIAELEEKKIVYQFKNQKEPNQKFVDKMKDLENIASYITILQGSSLGAREKLKQAKMLLKANKRLCPESIYKSFKKSHSSFQPMFQHESQKAAAQVDIAKSSITELARAIKHEPLAKKSGENISTRVSEELKRTNTYCNNVNNQLKQQRNFVKDSEYALNIKLSKQFDNSIHVLNELNNQLRPGMTKAQSDALRAKIKDILSDNDNPMPKEVAKFLKSIKRELKKEFKLSLFNGFMTLFNKEKKPTQAGVGAAPQEKFKAGNK